MVDLESISTIDLLRVCEELCEETPSYGSAWDNYWKNPHPPFKSFRLTPADKKYSEITFQIKQHNHLKEINYINLQFQSNAYPQLIELEVLLGTATPIVIGPSNPGYRDVEFSFQNKKQKNYSVSIFGRIDSYEIFPTSKISAFTLRRDKVF